MSRRPARARGAGGPSRSARAPSSATAPVEARVDEQAGGGQQVVLGAAAPAAAEQGRVPAHGERGRWRRGERAAASWRSGVQTACATRSLPRRTASSPREVAFRAPWRPSSATSIRSAAASPRPGTSSSAAATRSSSRASSARRPTSSSRTTCAPARAPSSTRYAARCDGLRGPLRLQGLPVHGGAARSCARRAWRCDVASGGELRHRAAGRLRPGADPPARQREVRARARARRVDGRRRPRRGRQPRRHRPARAARARRARRSACCCASRPGISPDTHPSISTGGPNTKFGFGAADGAARRSSASTPSDRLELEGLHLHIGSQIFDARAASARRCEAIAGLGDVHGMSTSAAASASPTSAPSTRRRSRSTSAAKVAAVHERHRARACGSSTSRAARSSPTRPSRSTRCESVKRNVDLYVAVDGGMSDNLRPMLYGARYEAAGRRSRFGGGDALPPRRQALRVGRRDRPRRRAAPTRAPGDVVVTPATGAYGYAMANNYNGVPRAAGGLRRGRRRARRRAPRDLRGPAARDVD